jgi:metal-responsive CopG/Arc/MetJ family transcriptional regulator
MKRTTIFADEDLLEELRRLAYSTGKSLSDTIRQALEQFINDHSSKQRPPSFLGIGQSGRTDIAERHEELLWATPHPKKRRR